jgi:transcription initiation factor TFIIF subunit alpha
LVPRKKAPPRRQNPPQRPAPQGKGETVQKPPATNLAPPNPPSSQVVNGIKANGGWSHTPTGPYQDFPLFTTKRALREGLRYHIARFSSKREIDPRNQDEFTRPISLHRRDPRQPVAGKGVKEDDLMTDEPIDAKEKEKQEILKAEREARRAADLAQIAPTGNNASAMAAKKTQAFRNEKTTQVHRLDKTEAQKKESDLRYEEALPWHLEDADNKNTWVGNYEAALSDTNVIFVIDGTSFKMVPIEKWYKFTQKNQFKSFTIEEAEARFSKATKESRWVMKTQERAEADKAAAETRKQLGRLYTVKAESKTFKNASKSEVQDADDLDFDDNDLFQDDDEQAFIEPDKDEDAKESKDRIKREQLAANIFDQANEADVDEELAEERREAEKRKKLGKEVKKALTKREKMTVYESDSSNPYASSVWLVLRPLGLYANDGLERR